MGVIIGLEILQIRRNNGWPSGISNTGWPGLITWNAEARLCWHIWQPFRFAILLSAFQSSGSGKEMLCSEDFSCYIFL